MRKILITTLGRGQFNKELGKYDYQLTNYKIDDNIKTSKLVSSILKNIFDFDKIFVIGTKESLWDLADEYLKEYEKIIIPYGKNEKEFWEIFEILSKLNVENSEVYFDMTHGFRSIPLFLSSILNFFEKVKSSKVKGVYYGVFEAKENNITPVINILPFLEMNRFIEGFYIFKNYSDGRELSKIIDEKFKEIENEKKKEFSNLKKLSKQLNFYSNAVSLSAAKYYIDSLNEIDEITSRIDKIPYNLKAVEFLIDDLKKESDIFEDLDFFYEKMLKTAYILYQKNRYAQSITILRETIPTYILEKLELDFLKKSLREEALSKAIKFHKEIFYKEFIKLDDKIKKLRNSVNHAFFDENSGEGTIKKAIDNLKEYLDEFNNLVQNEKIIRDKNALLDILKEHK